MRGSVSLWSLLSTLFFLASRFHHCGASILTQSQTFLPQGFLFDWNPPGTTVPIPVTQQCQTLHITWERGSTGVGPNPTSPYSLQIFTSTFVVPIVVSAGSGTSFDFQVPFSPGTQYQICMWGSNGVSGGCQAIYTVIQNTTTSTPSCQNVTYPASALQVDAAVVNGAFSQYGWIPQCTDIQVQATNGTPPYTLMVGPTLHPPVNITANSGPMNWTVTLSHGIPFFISVTDANGNGWAQGPLHSGDGPDTSCLDINHSASSSHSSTNIPVTVGATVGGVLFGLLAGALGISVIRRQRRAHSKHPVDLMRDSQISPIRAQSGHGSPTVGTSHHAGGSGLEYVVEPFAMPSPPSDPGAPLLGGSTPTMPDATSASGSDPADPRANRQNVYVVHHDGGRAPVTVYTSEGAEVVELPPRYPAGSTSSPSERESDTTRENSRRTGSSVRKARGPRPPT